MKTCTKCNKELPIEAFYWYATRNKRASQCCFCHRKHSNERNRFNRLLVLKHYGGDPPKCACCGVEHLEFLSLDHIAGGGGRQRRVIKIRWWEWLMKNGFPPGFRVLCHNCNQSIGLYGYCPHKTPNILAVESAAYDPTIPSKSYKLSREQVDSIRSRIALGEPQYKLALEYNVSRATICFINGGKRWAN